MKTKILLLSFFLFTCSILAQKSVNSYKYVLVPDKFDFLKTADKYQTSSLTKFLFKKYGFTAFLSSDKLPEEIQKNRCTVLFADVKNNSGIFTTKVRVELKDCDSKVIFTSKIGKSREKQYKRAYHEAIRKAFEDVQKLNYKYRPKITEVVKTEALPIVVKKTIPKGASKNNNNYTTLYAQIKNGAYQLVDTTPKIVYTILPTSSKELFIIKDKNGILYKSNSVWIAEYYENKQRIRKEFVIKF